ncbi:hypothetical protein [Escherichia coli]|uniref:hypothetical protein n=1 Tax=Escherichia coli TaxID=562 RepID=UPI002FCD466A
MASPDSEADAPEPPRFQVFQPVTFPASGDGPFSSSTSVMGSTSGRLISSHATHFIIHFDVNGWRIRCQALPQVAAFVCQPGFQPEKTPNPD